MVEKTKNGREHYGLITADIDPETKQINLMRGASGVKRELSKATLDRCLSWARSRLAVKYPGFELVIDGQVSDAAAS